MNWREVIQFLIEDTPISIKGEADYTIEEILKNDKELYLITN